MYFRKKFCEKAKKRKTESWICTRLATSESLARAACLILLQAAVLLRVYIVQSLVCWMIDVASRAKHFSVHNLGIRHRTKCSYKLKVPRIYWRYKKDHERLFTHGKNCENVPCKWRHWVILILWVGRGKV